jgi:hypothetical protein
VTKGAPGGYAIVHYLFTAPPMDPAKAAEIDRQFDEITGRSNGSSSSGGSLIMGDDPSCTHYKYTYTCDQNESTLATDSNGWTGNREIDGRRVQEMFDRKGIKY